MALPQQLQSLRLPVVAAPLFLASGPELALASCRAGIVGSLPALNHRTTEGFDEWVSLLERERTPEDAPFAVNLIVHRTNPRLEPDLEVVVKHQVPVVITSLGAVPDVVDAVHSYGGLVFHDVINARHARKAAGAGVDGLILVSAGAGGHAGTLNPFALLAEVRGWFDRTLILAGSLSTGADVLAARAAGADLAYMGTRFLATKESRAAEGHKQMILDAGAGDIVYTKAVSGVNGNFLASSLEESGIDPAGVAEADVAMEVKAWRDVWSAGQGVGAIDDVPSVSDLVERLASEYEQARTRLLHGR